MIQQYKLLQFHRYVREAMTLRQFEQFSTGIFGIFCGDIMMHFMTLFVLETSLPGVPKHLPLFVYKMETLTSAFVDFIF